MGLKTLNKRENKKFLIIFRIIYLIIGIIAILTSFIFPEAYHPTNFYERFIVLINFFTIQSNIIAIFVMGLSLIYLIKNKSPIYLDKLRLGAVSYLTITMIVFNLFLASISSNSYHFPSIAEHLILPLMLIIDWLIDPQRKPIRILNSIYYGIYPIFYFIWTQIVGYYYNWYPYFFINPIITSKLNLIINIIILLIFFITIVNIFNLRYKKENKI
ncbi:MAG: Pr6Pr family membrane protein [Methanobrevibacter sp.]|jgi:hypothetical protein|nr:Pr6Pr family membrane protein [Candidatus Methanoflexus mossambicus]